jgi:hypothetical protein
MQMMKLVMTAIAAALVLAAASARAAETNILIKAVLKATLYDASNGKILKEPVTNPTIIGDCTSTPGAQLVGVFDTVTKGLLALVVVDSCGNLLCPVATFSIVEGGDCVDTGAVGTKEEVVCPVSVSFTHGGGGALLCDTKLKLDSQGAVIGGSLKCSGIFVDDSGHPGTISITASAGFTPTGNCPQ